MNRRGSYNSERSGSFLYDDEKQLIDAYKDEDERIEAALEGISETMVKSRVRNEAASRYGLKDVLQDVHDDLERLYFLYTDVIEQPGGEWLLKDEILPYAEDEIKQLHGLLGRWIDDLEVDEKTRAEVIEAKKPLCEDLDDLNRLVDFTPEQQQAVENDVENLPEGLKQDMRERERRRDALFDILQDDGLYKMFGFVAENEGLPKKEYRERTKGQNCWAWWISRQLASKYGVVEKGQWAKPSYVLTDRGEQVKEVIERLEDVPAVGTANDRGESVREAARELIIRMSTVSRENDYLSESASRRSADSVSKTGE